jgi:hypothetical protein
MAKGDPRIYTAMGVKCKLWHTHDNQWGEGKVHVAIYYKADKAWAFACKKNPHFGLGDDLSRGIITAQDTPITCKRCLRIPVYWPRRNVEHASEADGHV